MADRVYNFSAGPAGLPRPVMERAQAEFLDYRGLGVSVMEISHRSAEFDELAHDSEQRLRDLLGVGADFAVLFLAGGATFQFGQVPMNLATPMSPGGYLVHGNWGRKAHAEAECMGLAQLVASSENSGFQRIPAEEDWRMPAQAAYLHIVSNETITGVRFTDWPECTAPLVADMSSDILSRPLDVTKFGVIYAGAQKNIGIAGLSLLIVRRDLLERAPRNIPGCFNWRTQEAFQSRYNTPPTFAWYMAGLVFDWLEAQGGLEVVQERNDRKAKWLYDQIDASGFYLNQIDPAVRSVMNVPFHLHDSALEAGFLRDAANAGLFALKGHKLVGGIRASIYNAMPEQGVRELVEFMRHFEQVNG